jgi:hypothetical protein
MLKLIECLFSIKASEQDNVRTLKVCNADYNHPATEVAAAYPIQCRIPFNIKKQIKNLSASGITPS